MLIKNQNSVDSLSSELALKVQHAIEVPGYPALRKLQFSVEQGIVSIRGQLPSFYLCQLALESVKRVPGVVRVVNQIDVVYDSNIRSALPDKETAKTSGHTCALAYNDSDEDLSCGIVPCHAGAKFDD
jgi:osmotically-inducible protein OsmY